MNYNMKRQIIFLPIALFLFFGTVEQLYAQKRHEFSISTGGGFSKMNFMEIAGEKNFGFSGNFGLGYHFFFTTEFGIGTGAELALYNTNFKMNKYDVNSMAIDIVGDDFEFRSTISGYSENERVTLLKIPLMLQIQSGGKQQYYMAVGGKVGFPLNGKFNSTISSLYNSGYYEYENSIYDSQEFLGFGKFINKKYEGDLTFKTTFFISIEAGLKSRISEKSFLYFGAYLDYGLNNIIDAPTEPSPFAEYNVDNKPPFKVNSVLISQYGLGNDTSPQLFADKVKPMAMGLKMRLAF